MRCSHPDEDERRDHETADHIKRFKAMIRCGEDDRVTAARSSLKF